MRTRPDSVCAASPRCSGAAADVHWLRHVLRSGEHVKALDGIRVLDLTHALAGPFCTYQLQLLGADVVKIERPRVGDDFRDFARLPGWDASPSFIAVNAGKRSVTVNLKHPDGQEVVRR